MKKSILIGILVSFLLNGIISLKSILAQERIIELDRSIPLTTETRDIEESIIETNPDRRIIYNVVNPSLLYYPAENNISGTSVIIAPGGALQILSIDNEGIEVAKILNENGVDAFVLKYSLVVTKDDPFKEVNENFLSDESRRDSMIASVIPYAMQDGLSAISYVRKNASEFGLNPNRIGFMGFSAGGTVTMSVVYNCNDENKPNYIAGIYPWIGEISGKVPDEKTPAFIVVANNDNLNLVPHSLEIYQKWNNSDQPVELHIFGKGGHGFGVDRNYNPSDKWIEAFVEWLGGEGFLWPEDPQGFYANISYKDLLRMQEAQEERMTTDWANTTRYHDDNMELMQGNNSNKVVFYGNSITDNWIRFDQDFFNENHFIDRGISGQTTSQMLVRFWQDVVNLNPSAVVILAGTNDIAENTGPISIQNIFGNIISMAEIAKSNNIIPILCSVLPVYQYSWNRSIKPVEKIIELNQMIRNYANDNDIPYVDYYSVFVDERGGFPQEYSPDGVHPNLEGYKFMEQMVLPVIQDAIE